MPRPKSERLTNEQVTAKKGYVVFTPERKLRFLQHYAKHGHQILAASKVGVDPRTVRDHLKTDPEFKAQYDLALEEFVGRLQEVGVDRCVDGVQRPLIGGRNKDEVVAYETVYDNNLLQFFLKTHSRQHAVGAGADEGGTGGNGNGFSGGVLIVPNRVQSLEDWERVYGNAARGMTGQPEGGA